MILVPETQTRVTDKFVYDNSINCHPIYEDVKSKLIPGKPNEKRYRFQSNFYDIFGLDIVTETVFNYPYPYISEKTLRPIASKRMFIVLGAQGILNLLHQKGFVTFPDILDENYDSIDDAKKRFFAVVASIKSYLDFPIEEIKDYYIKNTEKFEHNFNVLANLRQTELEYYTKKLGISPEGS
jgi:hypothetical protein